ncbi:MAG: 3'-5' exonuclease, partial [Candidatus Aenigmatarchaeota archaeon]
KLQLEKIEASSEENTEDEVEFSKLAFDLEVIDKEIVMASLYSEGLEKVLTTEEIDESFVETVEGEEELLKRFLEIIEEKDFDIITGYNT